VDGVEEFVTVEIQEIVFNGFEEVVFMRDITYKLPLSSPTHGYLGSFFSKNHSKLKKFCQGGLIPKEPLWLHPWSYNINLVNNFNIYLHISISSLNTHKFSSYN